MEPIANPPELKQNFWKELVRLVVIAVVIVVPFRLFIAQPFIVDGASMDPTFKNAEYLIVDELTYQFNTPERGSVLIFKYPKDPKKFFIKRVIGLPGEEVQISNGEVTIINSEYPKGLKLNEPYIVYTKSDTSTYVLGEEEYFVMGDNRAGSSDSRYWGAVPEENIVGRPIIRAWPLSLWPGSLAKFENAKN